MKTNSSTTFFCYVDVLEQFYLKYLMGGAMQFSTLLWISAGAGFCTLLGALLMFARRSWTDRNLALFLGLAAGVMTAVVLFDMLPSALAYPHFGGTLGGLAAGFLLMSLNQKGMVLLFSDDYGIKGLGYMIMLGIALHDLPEGMAIALGAEMKARTAMVIALGISLHNIPEGMAIAAPLLVGQVRRLKVLYQTLLVALVTPLGTYLGKITISLLPGVLPGLLGLASGIMTYIVLFQLWPQAHQRDQTASWKGFAMGIMIIGSATFI